MTLHESLKVRGSHIPDLPKGNVNASCDSAPVAAPLEDGEVCMGRKQVRRAVCVCVCTCLTNGERKNQVDQTNGPAGSELVRARIWECQEGGWAPVGREVEGIGLLSLDRQNTSRKMR